MDKTPYYRSAHTYNCGQHETVLTAVTNEYDYDGWAIIRESNASSCVRPFVAHDGRLMIAGVGHGSLGAPSYNTFNDNLMASVDTSNQSIAATYGCGSAGFYYYGLRFYNSSIGRWVSRDPIGEEGGRSLYGFVRNSALGRTDPVGLAAFVDAYLKPRAERLQNGLGSLSLILLTRKHGGEPPPNCLDIVNAALIKTIRQKGV